MRYVLKLLMAISVLFIPTAYGLDKFIDFADTSALQLNGAAQVLATTDGQVLRLTPAIMSQSGSAFSKAMVNAADFSTFFKFRITEAGGSLFDCNKDAGADGIVFVVQSVSSSIGGGGEGIGYKGIGQSVGVEFDTWCNEANHDPSSNHVAIDLNGVVDHGEGSPVAANVAGRFDDGDVWYAWIDYKDRTLEIRVSPNLQRPVHATLSNVLDIPQILGVNDAYVGFTSGTGLDYGHHDILAWEYRDHFAPVAGECSEEILAQVREETRAACRADPASCDIEVAGQAATLSQDLKLHIPLVLYDIGFGITLPLSADLSFVPQGNNTFWFRLDDFKILATPK